MRRPLKSGAKIVYEAGQLVLTTVSMWIAGRRNCAEDGSRLGVPGWWPERVDGVFVGAGSRRTESSIF